MRGSLHHVSPASNAQIEAGDVKFPPYPQRTKSADRMGHRGTQRLKATPVRRTYGIAEAMP
ncbi:hypothetical protein SBA1_840005 [Candidatus Sulfotelmatobacter kueseliae]|uniref:Uncharacterized protein n=1 Tax=Candidatus Sulfotelmatobacter kueseliae TaxID=2042962 RepID=A0A2U3L956_9BACT|nr:hypothetical protein SBA1_840005 [Candidatus Sulfotelmatobacter kueseliae]